MFYYGSFRFCGATRSAKISGKIRRNIFFFFGQAIVTGGAGARDDMSSRSCKDTCRSDKVQELFVYGTSKYYLIACSRE